MKENLHRRTVPLRREREAREPIRNLNRRDCPPGSSLVSVDLTADETSATGCRRRFAPGVEIDIYLILTVKY